MRFVNHEGYHDPTAGKAIRRAHRTRHRGRDRKAQPLTYLIGELPGFRKCYKIVSF